MEKAAGFIWEKFPHLARFSLFSVLNIASGNYSDSQPGSLPSYTTICLTIFIFRGEPDVYYRRHALCYFTSPTDRNFHETVHVQRVNDESPWDVEQVHSEMDWTLSVRYISHVNAGTLSIPKGEEMMPVDIVSRTPVTDKERDWNCLNFILEGLEQIVGKGLQAQEWYDSVQKELIDKLLDGAVT
ncbi:hypothetical protein QBC47DRAFT_303053 [Echria macrotheca]|uniref:Uncharacterized protein n=1 Tax=Echria macrotheca TaxID=438768 RepID=A0AAJ0FAF4_9PEZI|nr:hypothetical protein QBC47DRAFT_303053 [Echria macrotheca]